MRVLWQDRVALACYACFAVLVAGLALANDSTWLHEYGRAMDAAGLHLFFSGPLLMALAAVSAQRKKRLLGGFQDSLPDPNLASRSVWPAYGLVAVLIQVTILGACLGMAQQSGVAATAWTVQPVLRQLGMIVGFAAAGALLGTTFSSLLIPGLLTVASTIAALAFSPLNLRAFLLVGTGNFDFSFVEYRGALFALVGCFALGFVALSWPFRRGRRGRWVCFLVGNFALASAVVIASLGAPMLLQPSRQPRSCAIQTPIVCGPASLGIQAVNLAATTSSLWQQLPVGAREFIPRKFIIQSNPGRVGIYYETSLAKSPRETVGTIIDAFAGTSACAVESVTDDQAKSVEIVDGWLQHEFGAVVEGSFPSQEVARVRQLPRLDQEALITSLIQSNWACKKPNLEFLG